MGKKFSKKKTCVSDFCFMVFKKRDNEHWKVFKTNNPAGGI